VNLEMVVHGKLGPHGISPRAADLVDLAAAVFVIERQLRGRQRTNPAERFELAMKLREPDAWSPRAVEAVQAILLLLGNAEWSLEIGGGLDAPVPAHQTVSGSTADQVVLFSGGMDSLCGLGSISSQSEQTRLVSFYTRQKTLQSSLATELGFKEPVQWGKRWVSEAGPGRGHSYYYRSFLFLCLAAAVAQSWNVRRILQFENGILASAIPSSPSWMMTKHAHPALHARFGELCTQLFGGDWVVENPFALLTKRQCVERAAEQVGRDQFAAALTRTETCWFQASNRVRKPASEELRSRVTDGLGAWQKRPGTPCGFCIPCLIRRTAFQDDVSSYRWDLCDSAVMNDATLGAAFRSYYIFLQEISGTGASLPQFYRLLPAAGRSLLAHEPYTLPDLHCMWQRFSEEFMGTYGLGG
jgi:7-cyano-7-deazaguanine synthase in queuosine biosynthesis